MAKERYRILALDVDGTLLDRDGRLRPRTIEAISRAAAAGIRPVLCTGRRYRRALPVALRLGLGSPLVCNSGALVKEPEGGRTLWRADLSAEVVRQVLDLFGARGEPSITFTDRPSGEADFVVVGCPIGHALFDDYLDQNRGHAEVDPGWPSRRDLDHYHLCAIGDREAMLALEADVLGRLAGRVRTFVQKSPRYAGTMCEVLRHDASKWSALLHLAGLWDIDPAEICAMGDDMNDIPMLEGAGLGVAMGHATEAVRRAADLVTASDDDDGVAVFVEDVLLA